MLDRPEVLQYIFFPRRDVGRGRNNSSDYLLPAGDGVSLGCRFYACGQDSPSLLFFHGNGEVVGDYDDVAGIYNERGINLFAVDYRGYGVSGSSGDDKRSNGFV